MISASHSTLPDPSIAPEPLVRAVAALAKARIGRPCVPPNGEAGVALSGGPSGWIALAMPCIVHTLPGLRALAPGGWATDGANLWITTEAATAALEGWANQPNQALAHMEEVLFAAASRAVGQDVQWPAPWVQIDPSAVAAELATVPLGAMSGPWTTPGDLAAVAGAVHALSHRWPTRWPLAKRWAELAAQAPAELPNAPGATRHWRLWEFHTRPAAISQWRQAMYGRQLLQELPSQTGWTDAVRALWAVAVRGPVGDPCALTNLSLPLLIKTLAALPLGTPTSDVFSQHNAHPLWEAWAEELRRGIQAMEASKVQGDDSGGFKAFAAMVRTEVCPDAGTVWKCKPWGLAVAGQSQTVSWTLSESSLGRTAARAALLLGEDPCQPAAVSGSEPWVLAALQLAIPGQGEERVLVDRWIAAGDPFVGGTSLAAHLLKNGRHHGLAHALSQGVSVPDVGAEQALHAALTRYRKPGHGRLLNLNERLVLAHWAQDQDATAALAWARDRTRISDLAQHQDLDGMAVMLELGADPTRLLFDTVSYNPALNPPDVPCQLAMDDPPDVPCQLAMDEWLDRVLAAGADPFFQYTTTSGFVDETSAWSLVLEEGMAALRAAWSRRQAHLLNDTYRSPKLSGHRQRL